MFALLQIPIHCKPCNCNDQPTALWTEEIVRVTSSELAPRNSWRSPQIGTPPGQPVLPIVMSSGTMERKPQENEL